MSDDANTPRARRQSVLFAMIVPDIWNNPKVRRAGRVGGPLSVLVFVFALTKHAARGRTGGLPATDLDPWYLSDQLFSTEAEASKALDAVFEADLLARDGDRVVIVGWDASWKRSALTETEARQIRRLKGQSENQKQKEIEKQKQKQKEKKSSPDSVRTRPDNVRTLRDRDVTDDERKSVTEVLQRLSKQNGVQYTGSKDHTKLIVRQLRKGLTEMDLRKVIGYCADELGWKDKPEMAPYLRPETLFGTETISRYLDPARTWFSRLKEAPLRQPPGRPTTAETAMLVDDWEERIPAKPAVRTVRGAIGAATPRTDHGVSMRPAKEVM